MENRAEFLKQDTITKADIINKVLAPNHFDGLRASNDLAALVHEEQRRVLARKLVFFAGTGTFVSLYNLSRFSRLSPSGRGAAAFGLLFFSTLTYACLSESRLLGGLQKALPAQQTQDEKKEH